MTVLSINGLCKSYGSFQLRDVSFDVRRGEIMGFIGRNGAGKTTTLKSLLNLVHPDSGEVRFFGMDFRENELEIKGRIGFVSGGADFYSRKKLRLISSVSKSFYPNWDEAAYRRCMELFSLDENKTPAQLSAGMKVKYSLALALSHRAELLILDEPTSGLDPVSRDELLEIFLRLVREGVSILFSTHITSDLDKCADRITYIRNGRIAASEGIESFKNRYRLAELKNEDITDTLRPQLIGCGITRGGVSALVEAEKAASLGIATRSADLETIMVHLEKEENA
ncbi:MAG: ABC transporter ATP-binding protein [Clostridiales bacterium]|nr:ABC transporter ATP-binding protein [Clostridiales bacterium]